MFGRAKRQQADELRPKFLANREKVRSWVANWECPELAWPEISVAPSPWIVDESGELTWLERDAPFMDQYQWQLEARPLTEGITQVRGNWCFTDGHEFERLEIRTRTVADPGYLAELLTLAVTAAALPGWTDADTQPVYHWLFEGLDTRPLEKMVAGKNLVGKILLNVVRARVWSSQTDIDVSLSLTVTDSPELVYD